MQYLSEFEVLAEPIVPQTLTPGVTLPFVGQGWFLLLSRLTDNNAGPLQVKLVFVASGPLPTGKTQTPNQDSEGNPFILINYETGDDQAGNLPREVLVPGFTTEPNFGANAVSVTFPIGSGGTVLFGIQPDIANADADGPLAAGIFGWRGYVLIDAAPDATSHGGTFQLAAAPEIRATFFAVSLSDKGVPKADFSGAAEIAYVVPTANGPLITLSKAKEAKDKAEKEKEASKDTKDFKDKSHPEKGGLKDKVALVEYPQVKEPSGEVTELETLSRRLAALESLLSTSKPFITAKERPELG